MWWRKLFLILLTSCLVSCGFRFQGAMPLVEPLHTLYLQAADPYGQLEKYLRDNLKLSKVELVDNPSQAKTQLVILKDEESQNLLSVNGTQQTRQYSLHVTVTFEITDPHGNVIVKPQTLIETRTLTIQSNTILGSSNEATLYYQQMRRSLASSMMNILSSIAVGNRITNYFRTAIPANKENAIISERS